MAKEHELNGIDDVQNFEEVWSDRVSIADVLNTPFILNSWEPASGTWGDFIIMHCTDPETGVIYNVTTSAKPVLARLMNLPKNKLPVKVKFVQHGKSSYNAVSP